jgi:hypothetical protein
MLRINEIKKNEQFLVSNELRTKHVFQVGNLGIP